jgi:hypothetical protein
METHKIISVRIVPGRELNPRWKSSMQVIVTDKGKYIDNMPGISFSSYSPGFDWSSNVGKTVCNIQIIHNSGHMWLNRPPLTAAEIERRAEEVAGQTAARIAAEVLNINRGESEGYKKGKCILVLGASAISANEIRGVAVSSGIDPHRVVAESEYGRNTIDVKILFNRARYDWLLVGPTAHKLLGLGDYPSLLSRLKKEEDIAIPYIVLSDYCKSLKITKESIRNAFREIAKKESV